MNLQTIEPITPVMRRMTMDKLNIRNRILDFEAELKKLPGAFLGDNPLCPLKHTFSDGMYIREMFLPKGITIVGKIHKHEHPYFLMKGEVTVVTEHEGKKILKAPCSMISSAGTKRAIYANKDTVWITVHSNPYNHTNLAELEDMIIAKDFFEYEKSKEEKYINAAPVNCGLKALRNLSELKNTSIRTLIQMAEDNGLKLYSYKVAVDKLHSIPMPAILHSEDHFIYISTPDEIDSQLKYTGNILLTQKADYPEIKIAKQKKISGASFVSAGAFALYAGIVAAGTAIAGNTDKKNQARPQCEKDCKATCKSKHGALFSGRRTCIRNCRADCVTSGADMTPTPVKPGINWWYVAAGIIGVIAIILLIYKFSRKK